jgi:signal transduction histidine kinase/CheY-like chemotaxis protein/CHASE3 domain sensor protein
MTRASGEHASPPGRGRHGAAGGPLRSSLPIATFAGFAAAFAAVLAIAALSFLALDARTKDANSRSQAMQATRDLEAIQLLITDAETGQRGYLLTGVPAYLDPFNAAVADVPRQFDAARDDFQGDPVQLERLATLHSVVTEKLAELRRTVDLVRGGEREAALEIVRGDRGRELMDQIHALIGGLMMRERAELERRTDEWRRATARSDIVTWAGSGVLALLIAVAAVSSSRDFRAQHIDSWLRAGQSELANRTQGNQSVERLGDSIAAFLAEYLGAQVGAVYFCPHAGELRPAGSYGLPPGVPTPPPGGLTLQTLHTAGRGGAHLVSDVPDDYFARCAVSSGLGRSKPRHLLLAATSADSTPNGVVELGFFGPPPARARELLRLLAEPIGVALRSAKYRRDVENLLEVTQRQAEELQTQQEELRVNNEELEQQTRASQLSQQQLQVQQAELEHINSQLGEQAEALQRQRDDLIRAQRELQRTSAYKSEFLANMSHELRTPLNSLLILAKLLADNKAGNLDAEQVRFAQTIDSAGNDLLTLINDILDIAKVEAGKLDVRPERVPLRRVLDDLASTFQPVAHEKKLGLEVVLDASAPETLETDPTRIQQILKNLLSNAIKFTDRGRVTVHIRRTTDGRVAFAVSDTGIGIPVDRHERIFEAFQQGDGTAARKYGGTGLGLSISRELARLLGGELAVASAPGRGSTFTLTLPERYAPPAGLAPRSAPPRLSTAAASADVAPPRAAGDGDEPARRPILVIEDDVGFARIIQDLARELDLGTLLATTAEQGLALAAAHSPSAIVLDVGLPDRSGLFVLDALKHDPATRHIPVHVVSASDRTREALEMGAASYAIKPVRRDDLLAALKRLETKFTQKLRRVLVVEDDVTLRESTCLLLAGDDVETTAVGTGGEALAALRAKTFDCMVLDLSLPDRSGLQLLEEMSGDETGGSCPPVIVYTGRSLSPDEEQQLRRFSRSIIVKGARSPERLLDEVMLFLHRVEADLPPDRRRVRRDARHREAVFEGRRLLVVEDDVRNIFALSSVLEPKGAKVAIARNGREAITHLELDPAVDLVLMDVMMPEMDGLTAMREIRRRPALAKLPMIALTAKAMADDREQCLAAGANDYIAKPLDMDKLLSLARVWMAK